MTNAGHHIITTLCALLKGAGTERIQAEMRIFTYDILTKKLEGRLRSCFTHRYTEIPIAIPNNDLQC
jgi:hypothetical protein